jgi:hypothetical protein
MIPEPDRILPIEASEIPSPASFDIQKSGKDSSIQLMTKEKIQYTMRCILVSGRDHKDAIVAVASVDEADSC